MFAVEFRQPPIGDDGSNDPALFRFRSNSEQIFLRIHVYAHFCADADKYLILRFIIKRIWLFSVLHKFAKRHGYSCKTPLPCLLPNNREKSFVQIETDNTIYAVKLFGLLRKHCEIHFWNLEKYSVVHYLMRSSFVAAAPIGQVGAKRRSLGNGNWTVSSEKEVIPVLLISPAHTPVRLTRTDVNHLEYLRAGEGIENAIFADLDYLLRFIENRER